MFRLKINTEGLWQRTRRSYTQGGIWASGQKWGTELGVPITSLLVWFLSGPLCLVHYSLDHAAPEPAAIVSHRWKVRGGSQKLFSVSVV